MHKDHLRTERVLPMNALFEKACQIEKKMNKDKQLSKEQCENMRLNINRLYS